SNSYSDVFSTYQFTRNCFFLHSELQKKLHGEKAFHTTYYRTKILSTTVAKEPILRQSKKPTVVGFLRYKVLS
ncbi:hypothetical protein, partial [Streptococcus danieliae]|uniref:hypothetical protein n=1 Tax=Streptococcus danieliae TaxID=747656 RepID=UPI001C54DFFF